MTVPEIAVNHQIVNEKLMVDNRIHPVVYNELHNVYYDCNYICVYLTPQTFDI